MFIEVTGPLGHKEPPATIDNQGLSLGALLGDRVDNVDTCFINGRVIANWKEWVPKKGDRIHFVVKTGGPLAFLIPYIIKAVVMIALAAVTYALSPKPKKPKLDSKRAESFGIAGYNNTTGQGTPRFVPYGRNRVHGHVISSGVKLSPDGKSMLGRVLYSMGDTGGDQVHSISEVTVDETDAAQFEGMQVVTRLGADNQSVIPEFENVDNVFNDGRPLEFGAPITYTTRSNTVQRATIFFNFPAGLYRVNGRGATRSGSVHIQVEYKKTSESTWTQAPGSMVNYVETITSGMFKTFQVDLPTKAKYDIRVLKIFDNRVGDEPFFGDILLYNVQETEFDTINYGGDALLALLDIPAKKLRSLEAMRVSALVEGKRVKIPDGIGGFALQYTRQRCWIVRDMMTHARVGMGYEFTEDEIDDDQWIESQDYYDELVEGHDGNEPRDLCDFITNQSMWDWDYIKSVAGEGRGRIIPSGDKWKYLIDRPGDPGMLYTEGKGGNIIEDSIVAEIGPPDRDFHQIVGEFRNADTDYKADISPPINDPDIDTYPSIIQEAVKYETITRESQVDRENMIHIKRAKLEKRRWQWTSPASAIVSEPMDLSWFGERVVGLDGAYSGFLPAGSTTTKILLPELAELEAGFTYSIIVKHKDNTVEQRTVDTLAGRWIQIEVTSAFAEAPAEQDIFLLGKQNIDHLITRAQDLEIDDQGRVKQTLTEYIPSVYTPDALPPRRDRKNFKFSFLPPIPLRDAQVREEIVQNRDISHRSNLIFDVTPGLHKHSGQVANSGATTVDFHVIEPNRDDYFKGATIRIVENSANPAAVGQERKIKLYGGAARQGIVDAWNVLPTPGNGVYEIEWTRFGNFEGFKVEVSDDGLVGWSEIGVFFGTHAERSSDQRGARWFRFTPFGPNQVENTVARIVRQVNLTGDTSAPAAPIGVFIGSVGKNVTTEIHFRKPTAEDLAAVDIEFYRNGIGGPHIKTTQVGVSNDPAPTGTLIVRPTLSLEAENYDTLVICRARAVDSSGNASAFVSAPNGTVLKRTGTADIDPEAVSTISEYAAAADTNAQEIATLTAPNTGFSNSIWFKSTMANSELTDPAEVRFELRRGSITGPLIDETSIRVPGQGKATVNMIGRDLPGSGMHTYRVFTFDQTAATSSHSNRKMLIFEVKR